MTSAGRRRYRRAHETRNTAPVAAAAATTLAIAATTRVELRGRRSWSFAADLRIMAGASGGRQHRSAKEADLLLRAANTARGTCGCQYSGGGRDIGVAAVDQT